MLFYRIVEFMFTSFAASAVSFVAAGYSADFREYSETILFGMLILFWGFNYKFQKDAYNSSQTFRYYITKTLIAYSIYTAIGYIIYFVFDESLFKMLYNIWLSFEVFSCSAIASTVIFHAIMVATFVLIGKRGERAREIFRQFND